MSESPLDAERFDVIAWDDPVVRRVGFAHDHPYVETFWLPVLGPTALWMHRRLAREALARPEGCTIDVDDLARSLGVSSGGGQRGAFGRAMQRCAMFGTVRVLDPAGRSYAVRTHLPPLTRRHIERLPRVLRTSHPAPPSLALARLP